jgi:hypothetical protein
MRFAEDTLETILDPDALHAEFADGRPYNGADYRVQTWCITTSGQNTDLLVHRNQMTILAYPPETIKHSI